jgi:N-formylglutamate amidohydrolase
MKEMSKMDLKAKNLVSTLEGTKPILITCPHGTDPQPCPGGFPPRKGIGLPRECHREFNTVADRYTTDITIGVAENIFQGTEKWPYVVIFGVHRACIDANRPQTCAYEMPQAARYYCQYQLTIGDFVKRMIVEYTGSPGFLFDIHGADEISKNGKEYEIAIGTNNGFSILPLSHKALFEKNGLIYLLKNRGYEVSPEGKTDCEIPQYNGGYTVETFSSPKRIFRALCFQLEIAKSKRETESERKLLENDLAECIVRFCDHYCN